MMLLQVSDLVVKYGEITALKGMSLDVEEGKITTLIGANGAGKSTLLKTISGLLRPSEGAIVYFGENLTRMPAEETVKKGIAHCPEGRKVFPRQTIIENLRLGGFVRKDRAELEKDIQDSLDRFPILRERQNQQACCLSGGEQQMLVLCRALMSKPKLLMLDEPSMGLAPKIVNEVFEMIQRINSDGTTVLLIEQNAKKALKISHNGYVLEVGKIVAQDTSANLLRSESVQKAFLGG